jgi:spore coat polysaccharide biosynthesis protein SpsF
MLEHVLRRAALARSNALTVLATTVHPSDDVLAELGSRLGVAIVRGPEEDVLERYRLAVDRYGLDVVVRVTADCPLIDPALIDRAVKLMIADGSADYVSNTIERTFPRGYDVEAVRASALLAAAAEAQRPFEREHVTPFVWRQPWRFRVVQFHNARNLSSYRLTVDEADDLALVRLVWERLAPVAGEAFGLDAVAELLDREPSLTKLNAGVKQKTLFDR